MFAFWREPIDYKQKSTGLGAKTTLSKTRIYMQELQNFDQRGAIVPKSRPKKPSISAKKVAELAGVSRSAVSRTFTDGASVSRGTRAKVLAAAQKLGYHVNHLARGLIQHRSGIVCLIVEDLDAPHQAAFVQAATRRLQANGMVVMVLNTAGKPADVETALRQTLNYRADATIVLSGNPPLAQIKTCLENGQRVILIDHDDLIDGADCIFVDHQSTAQQAYLILRRAGCTRLAVLSHLTGNSSAALERAFIDAAAADGMSVIANRVGKTGYAAGVNAARQLLAAPTRPDGVFCVNDLMALGAMDVARIEFRLAIPHDLCVLGFDDIPEAGWLGYGLTTFRQPIQEITDYIGTLLENEDPDPPPSKHLPAQVVWRGTVRP